MELYSQKIFEKCKTQKKSERLKVAHEKTFENFEKRYFGSLKKHFEIFEKVFWKLLGKFW